MALCGPGIEMGGILSPCEKEGRREGARERESEGGREGLGRILAGLPRSTYSLAVSLAFQPQLFDMSIYVSPGAE